MRLLTGALFGVGVVWFGYPYLDDLFVQEASILSIRLKPNPLKNVEDFIRLSSSRMHHD
jgi:hypothetical protein